MSQKSYRRVASWASLATGVLKYGNKNGSTESNLAIVIALQREYASWRNAESIINLVALSMKWHVVSGLLISQLNNMLCSLFLLPPK